MPKLTDQEIQERLKELPGWSRVADTLAKQFTFATFPDAVAFIVRLAFSAEAADHHPDLLVNYRRVTVNYWTHSEGGITAKDIEGARAAEQLAGQR